MSFSVTQNTGVLKKREKEQKWRGSNFQLRFGKTEDGVCGETAEGLWGCRCIAEGKVFHGCFLILLSSQTLFSHYLSVAQVLKPIPLGVESFMPGMLWGMWPVQS